MHEVVSLALTLGLLFTAALWLVALASWFNWKNYFAGGHEGGSVAAIALAFTLGAALPQHRGRWAERAWHGR